MKYYRIKVTVAAGRDLVKQIKADRFEVMVKAKPEMGLANQRILTLMANYLSVPIIKVRLISGHQRRFKVISVLD